MQSRRKKSLLSGGISFIGATACALIASELWSDLTEETNFFPHIKPQSKVIFLIVFSFWCVLETQKVRKRITETIS